MLAELSIVSFPDPTLKKGKGLVTFSTMLDAVEDLWRNLHMPSQIQVRVIIAIFCIPEGFHTEASLSLCRTSSKYTSTSKYDRI